MNIYISSAKVSFACTHTKVCCVSNRHVPFGQNFTACFTNIPVILPHIWVSVVSTANAWHASHVKLRTCTFEDLKILKSLWQGLIHYLTNCLIISTVWSDPNIHNDLGVTCILIFRSSLYSILTHILHYFSYNISSRYSLHLPWWSTS